MASVEGISGLTIGALAERTGLSKSGLFAHFGSKEMLQQAVLGEACDRFIDTVVRPALARPAGLPRLEALLDNWIAWTVQPSLPGGCIIRAASLELDDKPGAVRDFIIAAEHRLLATFQELVHRAQALGQLRADLDVDRLVFEATSIMFGCGHVHRLLGDPRAEGFARAAVRDLLDRAKPADGSGATPFPN